MVEMNPTWFFQVHTTCANNTKVPSRVCSGHQRIKKRKKISRESVAVNRPTKPRNGHLVPLRWSAVLFHRLGARLATPPGAVSCSPRAPPPERPLTMWFSTLRGAQNANFSVWLLCSFRFVSTTRLKSKRTTKTPQHNLVGVLDE